MLFKFGRLPAVHNRHTLQAALSLARALDPLGTPPAISSDYVSAVDNATGGDWGCDGNNSVGDCTIADCGHQVMLHTANTGSIVIPSAADCLAAYAAWTGFNPDAPLQNGQNPTDQGADETSICQHMITDGLCGQKSAATAMVDPGNLDHLRWAVQLFGACRLGINVTDDMMSQFSAGQPWETFTGNVEGGHDVPIVKFDAQYAYVVTWAKLQPVSWSLVANSQWLDEAHAEVFPDFVRAGGTAPNGFDLPTLLADLAALKAAA